MPLTGHARALRQWLTLPDRTRNLVRRHPDLLVAFERWRRTHPTPED